MRTIYGQDWKEALARKEPNEVVNQIRERLKHMVTYNKLREDEWACMVGTNSVGQIYRGPMGDYVFLATSSAYTMQTMKDITFKLESLNTKVIE